MGEKYTSDELFHFVGWRNPGDSKKNYETLYKILKNKCISHWPHLNNWGETRILIDWEADLLRGELVVPTVTCYADIPFESLATHTKKYGQFGLAIDRDILAYYGARPVTYMPYNPSDTASSVFGRSLINRLFRGAESFENLVVKKLGSRPKTTNTGTPATTPEAAISEISTLMIKDVLAFVKPFALTRVEQDPANYYMEREWRKYGNLLFRAEWVKRIVVAPDYVDTVKADVPEFADRVSACPG
jgi:hypothetical protein